MYNIPLTILCLATIHLNVSSAHSYSAIQRYRDLHEAFRKPDLTNSRPGPNVIQRNLIDNTDAIITERNLNDIDVNDVDKGTPSTERTTTTSTPFWHSSNRFASGAHLTEISSPTIADRHFIEGNTNGVSTSTFTTTPMTIFQEPLTITDKPRAATAIPFPTSTKKLSASLSKISCTSTCGICTEITSISGIIQSPNYPENYYSPTLDIGYMYCQYTITAHAGKRIYLIFQELNLAFTDWGDFLEIVDKSPKTYGKVLATFNAGDEASVATMTSGESILVFFEANQGGYTKNGKAPSWRATYFVVEDVELLKSSVNVAPKRNEPRPYLYGFSLIVCLIFGYISFTITLQ